MKNTANRIHWVDALKGLAIICVTLGHLGCNIFMEKHIYSFHMFVFFFLSGYVDKAEDVSFGLYFVKKIKSLLIPFISWDIISSIVALFMGKSLAQTVRTMLVLDGEICWNAPIWFLLILFFTQILYTALRRYFHINDVILMLSALLIWVLLPQSNIIFKLNLVPMAISFYSLGIIYKKYIQPRTEKFLSNNFAIAIVLALLLCINIIFGVIFNIRIVYTKAVFGNIFYCIIAALSGTLFYVTAFRSLGFLGKIKLLNYLGNRSLIIMTSQFFLFNICDILMGYNYHLLRNDLKAVLMCIGILAIICLAAELVLCLGKKSRIIRTLGNWFGI